MRISEVLDFDDYYHDPRFAVKKPDAHPCGDTIYFQNRNGQWQQDAHAQHHVGQLVEAIGWPRRSRS